MRIEGSVTAISWIPSEAIEGLPKLPVRARCRALRRAPRPTGSTHLGQLRDEDRFREANLLGVDRGRGRQGRRGRLEGEASSARQPSASDRGDARPRGPVRGSASSRSRRFCPRTARASSRPWRARACPRRDPSAAGRCSASDSATAWTTLALHLHADGGSKHELVGASPFPRHWIYDDEGGRREDGDVDFKKWYRESYGENTPWGEEDSPAVVTAAETALERELSQPSSRGEKVRRPTSRRGRGAGDARARRATSSFSPRRRPRRRGRRRAGRREWALERCSANALARGRRPHGDAARAHADPVAVIPAELVAEGELATLAADRRREE